jgi:Tfp pilus assembly protein PilO
MAGLVALLVLLAMIYLFPLLQQHYLLFNEALDLKQRKLAKYRQTVLGEKVVKQGLLRLRNTFKRAEAGLLGGETDSLAAAEIQQILTDITDTAGAQILTVRILQPDRSADDIYLAIPIEVTINATMRQLTELLYELDRSAKLLRIAKLGIRPSQRRSRFARRGRRAKPVNSTTMVTTTLTVEGFVKKMDT